MHASSIFAGRPRDAKPGAGSGGWVHQRRDAAPGVWETWEALGMLWEALGSFGEALGSFGEPLGGLWEALGMLWKALGRRWEAVRRLWGSIEENFGGSGRLSESFFSSRLLFLPYRYKKIYSPF